MDKVVKTILFIYLFASACDKTPVISSDNDKDSLQVKLEIESRTIEKLEDLEAQFTVINKSDAGLTYNFPDGCQYGFTIQQDQDLILDSRKIYSCIARLTNLELDPNESKSYQISLSQGGNYEPLVNGTYTITAFLLEDYSSNITESFQISRR